MTISSSITSSSATTAAATLLGLSIVLLAILTPLPMIDALSSTAFGNYRDASIIGGGRSTGSLVALFRGAFNYSVESSLMYSLSTGLDGDVNVIIPIGSSFLVGGSFSSAGSVHSPGIVVYNGSDFSPLPNCLLDSDSISGRVKINAIYVNTSTQIYIAGIFTSLNGNPAGHIAVFDGYRCKSLGVGLDKAVYALDAVKSKLYVGGIFDEVRLTAELTKLHGLAIWHSHNESWAHFPGGGVDREYFPDQSSVKAIFAYNDQSIYIGGDFMYIDGENFRCVALWNGMRWDDLKSGLTNERDLTKGGEDGFMPPCTVNVITAVLPVDDGLSATGKSPTPPARIYFGGTFQRAYAGVELNHVASWVPNYATWSMSRWEGIAEGFPGIYSNALPEVLTLHAIPPARADGSADPTATEAAIMIAGGRFQSLLSLYAASRWESILSPTISTSFSEIRTAQLFQRPAFPRLDLTLEIREPVVSDSAQRPTSSTSGGANNRSGSRKDAATFIFEPTDTIVVELLPALGSALISEIDIAWSVVIVDDVSDSASSSSGRGGGHRNSGSGSVVQKEIPLSAFQFPSRERLRIPPLSLTVDHEYEIRATTTLKTRADASTGSETFTLGIVINGYPHSGVLSVSPNAGFALDTQFTMRTSGWRSLAQPLQFQFGFVDTRLGTIAIQTTSEGVSVHDPKTSDGDHQHQHLADDDANNYLGLYVPMSDFSDNDTLSVPLPMLMSRFAELFRPTTDTIRQVADTQVAQNRQRRLENGGGSGESADDLVSEARVHPAASLLTVYVLARDAHGKVCHPPAYATVQLLPWPGGLYGTVFDVARRTIPFEREAEQFMWLLSAVEVVYFASPQSVNEHTFQSAINAYVALAKMYPVTLPVAPPSSSSSSAPSFPSQQSLTRMIKYAAILWRISSLPITTPSTLDSLQGAVSDLLARPGVSGLSTGLWCQSLAFSVYAQRALANTMSFDGLLQKDSSDRALSTALRAMTNCLAQGIAFPPELPGSSSSSSSSSSSTTGSVRDSNELDQLWTIWVSSASNVYDLKSDSGHLGGGADDDHSSSAADRALYEIVQFASDVLTISIVRFSPGQVRAHVGSNEFWNVTIPDPFAPVASIANPEDSDSDSRIGSQGLFIGDRLRGPESLHLSPLGDVRPSSAAALSFDERFLLQRDARERDILIIHTEFLDPRFIQIGGFLMISPFIAMDMFEMNNASRRVDTFRWSDTDHPVRVRVPVMEHYALATRPDAKSSVSDALHPENVCANNADIYPAARRMSSIGRSECRLIDGTQDWCACSVLDNVYLATRQSLVDVPDELAITTPPDWIDFNGRWWWYHNPSSPVPRYDPMAAWFGSYHKGNRRGDSLDDDGDFGGFASSLLGRVTAGTMIVLLGVAVVILSSSRRRSVAIGTVRDAVRGVRDLVRRSFLGQHRNYQHRPLMSGSASNGASAIPTGDPRSQRAFSGVGDDDNDTLFELDDEEAFGDDVGSPTSKGSRRSGPGKARYSKLGGTLHGDAE